MSGDPISMATTIWRSCFRRSDDLLLLRSLLIRPFLSLSRCTTTAIYNPNGDEYAGSDISAYQRTLKSQRPSTIRYKHELKNSISLIGVVTRPVQPLKSTADNAGAYTVLKVKSSNESTHVWILLNMWGKMADICTTHLKQDDLIYVSGHLGSYSKSDKDGISNTSYKVNVMNINYVQNHSQAPACAKAKQSKVEDLGESSMDRYNNRLHLWQVFFANPLEWYDCRSTKKSPNHPDFRHKDTGEVLWLKHNDPPWIRKQLELQDSRLAGRRTGASFHLTSMVYDDL